MKISIDESDVAYCREQARIYALEARRIDSINAALSALMRLDWEFMDAQNGRRIKRAMEHLKAASEDADGRP